MAERLSGNVFLVVVFSIVGFIFLSMLSFSYLNSLQVGFKGDLSDRFLGKADVELSPSGDDSGSMDERESVNFYGIFVTLVVFVLLALLVWTYRSNLEKIFLRSSESVEKPGVVFEKE